jgi:hypothetical protein
MDEIRKQNFRFAKQYYDKDKFEQLTSVGPLGRVSG